MPPDLALKSTLIGSNYPCLELIFMVPMVFESLKFDCTLSKFRVTKSKFRGLQLIKKKKKKKKKKTHLVIIHCTSKENAQLYN